LLAERAHQSGAQEVDGRVLLQRRINRMTVSFFGSANLVRPGLRPNGPSDIASRHRPLGNGASWRASGWAGENGRSQRHGHASSANRSGV